MWYFYSILRILISQQAKTSENEIKMSLSQLKVVY